MLRRAAAATHLNKRPMPGEVIFCCRHLLNENLGVHKFLSNEPIECTLLDGSVVKSPWLLVCDDCDERLPRKLVIPAGTAIPIDLIAAVWRGNRARPSAGSPLIQ